MISRRRLLSGVLVCAAFGVSGCSFSERDTLRRRLKRGAPDDGLFKELLSDSATTVEPVALPALRGWQIVDVTHRGMSHPQRWFVGLTTKGDPVVVFLSGHPDRWGQIATNASVDSDSLAEQVARTWFDATRSMQSLGYRIDSVEDIKWSKKPGSEVAEAKDRIADQYSIAPPHAERSGDGWQLTLWTMEDQKLIEHRLVVSQSAKVTDTATVRKEGLPAAIGT